MAWQRLAAKKISNYVSTLTTKAMEERQEQTSEDITRFIHKQMVSDIRTRVNTILAIGMELGRVTQEGNRYRVNKGIVRLDRSLDNCDRKKKINGRFGKAASKCRCRMKPCKVLDRARAPRQHKREDRKYFYMGGRK